MFLCRCPAWQTASPLWLPWQSLPLCPVVTTILTSLPHDSFFVDVHPDKLLHIFGCHDNPDLSAWLSQQSWPLCPVVATILTSLPRDGFFADFQPDKLFHLFGCHDNPDLSAWLSQQSWPLCPVVTTILTSLPSCHNNPDLSAWLSQQSWPLCLVVTTILTSLPGCHNNPDLSAWLSQQSWPLCPVVTTILTSLPRDGFFVDIQPDKLLHLFGFHDNPDLSAWLSQQSWPLCPVVTTILTSLPRDGFFVNVQPDKLLHLFFSQLPRLRLGDAQPLVIQEQIADSESPWTCMYYIITTAKPFSKHHFQRGKFSPKHFKTYAPAHCQQKKSSVFAFWREGEGVIEGLTSPEFAGECQCERGLGRGKGGGHGRWGRYWVGSSGLAFVWSLVCWTCWVTHIHSNPFLPCTQKASFCI